MNNNELRNELKRRLKELEREKMARASFSSAKAERIMQINKACQITRERAQEQINENRKSCCMTPDDLYGIDTGFFSDKTFGRG